MNFNYKSIFTFCVSIFLVINSLSGQSYSRVKGFISVGQSFTGNLKYSEVYQGNNFQPIIEITENQVARNTNLNVGFGVRIIKSLWFTGSIGSANFGFFYKGPVTASPVNTASVGGFIASETYKVKLLEISASIEYKINLTDNVDFVIQPGFAWYTNPKQPSFQTLRIFQNSNNYSALLFTGVELPLVENIVFLTAGLNLKAAIGDFAASFENEENFYPYAIGVQTSVSYRF